MDELIRERNALARALSYCDPGGFPGSREWKRERDAIAALEAFDTAHPEVIAHIQAAQIEKHRDAIERAD